MVQSPAPVAPPLRDALESLSDPAAVFLVGGLILYANDHFARIFCRSAAALQGANLAELLPGAGGHD